MARIWEIAKPEHGRLLLSVVLAVLGVVAGIVPFVSAAKVISGMISGNREWSYYSCSADTLLQCSSMA